MIQSANVKAMAMAQGRAFLGMNLLSFVKAMNMNMIVDATHPAKPATQTTDQA